MSLGETTYLEIIGPDPQRSTSQTPRLFNIDHIDRPRLLTWAAKGSNLTDIVASARSGVIDLGDVLHGNRVLPDGTVLEWQMTDPYTDRMGGIIPFFIDWGDTAHPAAALPGQCKLVAVNLEHPHAEEAEPAMKAIGMTTQVARAATAAIRATIRTPNGTATIPLLPSSTTCCTTPTSSSRKANPSGSPTRPLGKKWYRYPTVRVAGPCDRQRGKLVAASAEKPKAIDTLWLVKGNREDSPPMIEDPCNANAQSGSNSVEGELEPRPREGLR